MNACSSVDLMRRAAIVAHCGIAHTLLMTSTDPCWFAAGRLSNRERKRTITEELLADPDLSQARKRRFNKLQVRCLAFCCLSCKLRHPVLQPADLILAACLPTSMHLARGILLLQSHHAVLSCVSAACWVCVDERCVCKSPFAC